MSSLAPPIFPSLQGDQVPAGSAWKGIYVANGGYDAEQGERAVSDGSADAVAYGRLFLANPDLPTRLSRRGPLNVPDTKSFYGGDERGYIDYPEWAESGT